MLKKRGRALSAALAALAMGMVSLVAGAAPSSAYDRSRLIVTYALVSTQTCARIAGNLTVTSTADSCVLDDTADGTVFKKQNGGVAVKIVVNDSLGMLAKLEFHPNGDKAWIYDTRNDGDGIYFQAYILPPGGSGYVKKLPFTTAPGTSASIDYIIKSLDLAEGTLVSWSVADDSGGSLPIWIYDSGGTKYYTVTGTA